MKRAEKQLVLISQIAFSRRRQEVQVPSDPAMFFMDKKGIVQTCC